MRIKQNIKYTTRLQQKSSRVTQPHSEPLADVPPHMTLMHMSSQSLHLNANQVERQQRTLKFTLFFFI